MNASERSSDVLGTFVIDITPDTPIHLSGFKHRTEPANVVHDRLEANGLVFSTQSGRPLALVSLDLLECGELESMIQSTLRGNSIDMDLVLAASHTHCGPGINERLSGIGPTDARYLGLLGGAIAEQLARIVSEPAPSLRPHSVAVENVRHVYAINRRRWGLQLRRKPLRVTTGSQRRPNRRGAAHNVLSSIAVRSSAGDLVGLIWTAHCHPTSAPWTDAVSADYPGAVRALLRDRLQSSSLPVVFLQGGGANVRATVTTPRSRFDTAIREVKHSLGLGGSFRVPESHEWDTWAAEIATNVPVPTGPGEPLDVHCSAAVRTLPRLSYSDSTIPTLTLSAIRLSPRVKIVGANVELMAEHVTMLEQQLDGVLAIGYLGNTVCYWPTTKMLTEGGYEVDESLEYFGLTGCHVSDPDSDLMDIANEAISLLDHCQETEIK